MMSIYYMNTFVGIWNRLRISLQLWPWATEERQCRLQKNEWKIGNSGEPWCIWTWRSFMRPFLFGPLFFRTALPCSGGYHLERGGVPLHDAVGVNCQKGATTENQGEDQVFGQRGVCWWLCVCHLTWHGYPFLVERESHGILLYYICICWFTRVWLI